MAEELNVPDQPDGIDMDSFDLPKPQDAATRVDLFLEWYGDGRVETLQDGPRPLYARDMQALTYAVRDLLWLHAEAAWRHRTEDALSECDGGFECPASRHAEGCFVDDVGSVSVHPEGGTA